MHWFPSKGENKSGTRPQGIAEAHQQQTKDAKAWKDKIKDKKPPQASHFISNLQSQCLSTPTAITLLFLEADSVIQEPRKGFWRWYWRLQVNETGFHPIPLSLKKACLPSELSYRVLILNPWIAFKMRWSTARHPSNLHCHGGWWDLGDWGFGLLFFFTIWDSLLQTKNKTKIPKPAQSKGMKCWSNLG